MIKIEGLNLDITTNTTITFSKLIITILSILILIGLFTSKIDKVGQEVVQETMKDATVVFGISKGLNAAISLAQGTQIGPPGVTLSVGEVLDPINDLVEQFSWIMLAVILSLGFQNILMNFVSSDGFNTFLILTIIIMNIWMFTRFNNDKKLHSLLIKGTILLIFLRFSIPVMSLTNSYFYDHYVKNDYNINQTKQMIQKSSDQISSITDATLQEKQEDPNSQNSFLGSLVDDVKKAFDIDHYKNKINLYKEATQDTGEYILDLSIAFIFKTIVFPLLFLILFYKLIKAIFRGSIDK